MGRIVERKVRHYLIAIKYLVLLAVVFYPLTAPAANTAGTVTYLNGPLLDRKADGSIKTLARDSAVEKGDTLITGKRTYARIKFLDSGEMTLRPDSQFKVDSFSYDQAKPKEDKAAFELVKGGLRAITGQVGKRGDSDSYKMKVPSGTIGIRGTTFEVRICEGDCPGLADGVYIFVIEGSITITNNAGFLMVNAGQYAYAKNMDSPPVILPDHPGIEFGLPDDIQEKTSSEGCIVR